MGSGVRRRELIAAMLQQGGAASQADLCAMLLAHGISATQATISRDLRELGASKGPGGYFLPGSDGALNQSTAEAGKSLRQALQTYLRSAEPAGNLLVLRTGPGQAQVVALEFDRHPQNGVVGVIAGDDTIFLAMATARAAVDLASHVKAMAGLARIGGAA